MAKALVGHGTYKLGTGDHDTPDDGFSDCAGVAICKCYGIPRHRPGFNRDNPSGIATYDVESDLNSNSALGDAFGNKELFSPVGRKSPSGMLFTPTAGDLLCYPTKRIRDAHGEIHVFVGHVVIVTDTYRWDRASWRSLDIVQMHGPDGRTPGITAGTGAHFDDYDEIWPKEQHCSWLLRTVP